MTTRLLFLPDDQTAIELESHLDAEEVEQEVRAGCWSPPADYARRFAGRAWSAIRQGRRVIILPDMERPAVRLSTRHRQVLIGLADGLTLKELAGHLGISPRTLSMYVGQIKQRLGTTTLAQSVSRAAALGLFHLDRRPG